MGALGGAMAGYLLSNDKLREELAKAKDAESAAKTLGKHLQQDGSKIAKDVQAFVKSEDVQNNLSQAKKFAASKFKDARKSVEEMMKKGTKKAGSFMTGSKSSKKPAGKKKGFEEKNV